MKKLRNLYASGLYKLSMWGAGLVNRAMLHLIELNGLDPNSDPEQLRYLHFKEDLDQAVDPRRFESGSKRAYAKISVPINPGSKHDMPHDQAYKIKSTYPKGGVEDFSNAGDPEPVSEAWLTWKKLPKRPMTPSEVMAAHSTYVAKAYTPATESRQPPIAVAYSPSSPPSDDLVAACDNFKEICESFVTTNVGPTLEAVESFGKDLNELADELGKKTEIDNTYVTSPAYTCEDQKVFEALDKAIQSAESSDIVDRLKKTAIDILNKKNQKAVVVKLDEPEAKSTANKKKKAKLKRSATKVKKGKR